MRLALLLAASLFATQALAQQTQQQYQPIQPGAQADADRERGVNVDVRTGDDSRRAHTDRSASHDKTMRVSELTGTEVRNEANEDLGSIYDVVIDLEEGKVSYVAVAVGGVLGVGSEMFAVPLEALECRQEDDEKIVIWNIDKQTIENAEGFNSDNWPDEANQQFQAGDRQRIGQRPTTDRQTPRPIQPQQQQQQRPIPQ